MSADLFAAFGDSPATLSSTPQQNPTSSDAGQGGFDRLQNFNASIPQSQTKTPVNNQKPQGPSLHQQLLSSQAASWDTTANTNLWGGLGGLGGFQSQPPASIPTPAQKPKVVSNIEEDEEGWGDFEVATPVSPPKPLAMSSSKMIPKNRRMRASTIELMSNKLFDLDLETSKTESYREQTTEAVPKKPTTNPNPDVLFDADFEADNVGHEGDDFGDFETVGAAAPTIAQPPPVKPSLDLLSLDAEPVPPKKQPPGLSLSSAALASSPSPYPQAPKSPYGSSFQDRKPEPVKALQVKPVTETRNVEEANPASATPITAWPGTDEGFFNKWEPFEDEPAATKPTATKNTPTKPLAKSRPPLKPTPAPTATNAASAGWEWQDWGAGTETQSEGKTSAQKSAITTAIIPDPDPPRGPPPTNIPPPSVLLSLFPTLLDLANISLLKPLLALAPSSPGYQKVLSSPETLNFLKGYLALATVSARIIAGRKHRWHRDKFLSQSMSISAAGGAGKISGMKLQGLDKTQAAREDREAAEVVEMWKTQVGRLRTVVAGVNSAKGENLKIPEVSLTLAVSTAKGVPTEKKPCVVCGLRREERVSKVDFDVEDSFGEWWVEFWGHRGCVNFWVGHEKELRGK
ncbi:hypothetical protein QBC42DRAFT_224813 [Cladorrhinum samala]|uniref:Uncharacterized protein n=1 Tax=Cladorrhinum samala TaxID=585594 RepID=A0AAV9HTX6_9PEZI|nr:hypothetical protein QBC42DRAFT_224813 [Cladorrhinum samala]